MTKRKKLTDAATSFSDWFAAYLVQEGLQEKTSFSTTEVYEICRQANIRGYIRGSQAAVEVYKKTT